MSHLSVKLQLFDGWRGSLPVEYTFQPDAHSVSFFIRFFRRTD